MNELSGKDGSSLDEHALRDALMALNDLQNLAAQTGSYDSTSSGASH